MYVKHTGTLLLTVILQILLSSIGNIETICPVYFFLLFFLFKYIRTEL